MRLIDKLIFIGIILLTVGAVVTLVTQDFKLGLDLDGGAHLVYEAQLNELPEGTDADEAMKGIVKVIERRVNTYGVSEPLIEQMGDDRVLVQLPGIDDIEEAKARIGKTALIEFREKGTAEDEGAVAVTDEFGSTTYWIPATGTLTVTNENGEEEQVEKQLTSQYFDGDVDVVLSGTYNRPILRFKWTSEGAQLSEQITTRLLQQPLGIFVDEELVSAPNVNAVITDSGVIEGMSLNEAKDLRDLLNAGRIPVPLVTIEEHDVSPTLGEDFVDWSIKAGIVGMALLIIFLIFYYRLPGIMSSLALLVYAALVLAIFQLVEVVLTLAGLAGFILSIGMAVDANVLIFERMKEEIRNGRTIRASVEVGFNRAWPAIRDSNISTFITCGILYWMGDSLTVPTVKGFAVTLFIGVAMSMFSAIIITRTFLRLLGSAKLIDRSPMLVPAQRPMMFSRGGR